MKKTPAILASQPEDSQKPEKLPRARVAQLDRILGLPISVLDNGFIRVVDYMGDEAAIVQAARVSYGKGTKRAQSDVDLIRYLLRHRHTTPFEMCEIKLHLRVPMDCWRQWIRHRTASVNEYSTRYSLAIDVSQMTEAGAWRAQASSNRQGSEGFLSKNLGMRLSKRERHLHAQMREVYAERIAAGVAREQARKDLPLSTYTEAYWKIDLHNLLHFLELRMNVGAQVEIREYAGKIGSNIVAKWVPNVWAAFANYRLNSIQLSEVESDILRLIIGGNATQAISAAKRQGLLKVDELGKAISSRERFEFERKVKSFGVQVPWQKAAK